MKNILLTGGLGYIGSHVCIELINKGYEVIIIDNLCNSSIEVLKRIKIITGVSPIFYEKDIRDKATLIEIFNKHSFFNNIIDTQCLAELINKILINKKEKNFISFPVGAKDKISLIYRVKINIENYKIQKKSINDYIETYT